MNSNSQNTVLVAMSGGVDSAVAAALIQEQGYNTLGVTMQIWDGPPAITSPEDVAVRHHGCYGPEEEADIADARAVAAKLHIPFTVIDLRTGVPADCAGLL